MASYSEVPVTKPDFDESEIGAVAEVIRSGWVTQGRKVEQFESAVANYVGSRHAIATTSCSTAMHLAFYLKGIHEGHEVIMASYTCPASANAVRHCGAIPAFVEIDPKTFNIDPSHIEGAINSRTRGILAIHQFGLPADMDEINEIASRHNLIVIEDAGVALGSAYKGKKIGSLGAPTCFSFHGRKIITMGEGGMMTTNDGDFAETARVVRSHGASVSDLIRHQAKGVIIQEYKELGYNFRLTDIQAAIGLVQMRKLPSILKRRQALAQRYDELLSEVPEVEPPLVPTGFEHSYQSYVITLTPLCSRSRDEVLLEMAKRGISCRHTLTCHDQPYFRKICGLVHLPITEEVTRTTITLPLYPTMTEGEQDYVVASLKEILVSLSWC